MVDRAVLHNELKKIRHLIDTRPDIKARFDKDGNGVIDGEEWEEVRQLVIRRLERKEAEAAAARADNPDVSSAATPPAAAVAEQVVHEDLAPVTNGSGDLQDHDELILEQGGGLGQLMEQVSFRRYTVRSRDGRELAYVQQQQNEAVQNLANKNLFDVPELDFSVSSPGGPSLILTRRYQGMGMRIDVGTEGGGMLAYCQQMTTLLRLKMKVAGGTDAHPIIVQRPLLKPFTLDIRDSFDERIGVVERGWSGLGGLLSGGNLTRVSIRPEKGTPGRRLGLLAAALMIDLLEEDRRNR